MTRPGFGQGPGPGPGPAGLAWPAGRPARIREAARRITELGQGIDAVADRAGPLATVEGWTGPPAVTWGKAVGAHASALARGGEPLQQAGRLLLRLAEEMEQAREAIHRLADEVCEAEALADRAARRAVEVRRTWMAGIALPPGAAPPADVPDRVAAADAAALAAADEADEVVRRCLHRSRARRDEVRACDRRAAAALEQATAAAPVEGAGGPAEVGWCGTTAGGRPPRGPRGPQWQAAPVSVDADWAPTGGGRPPQGWAEPADLAWQSAGQGDAVWAPAAGGRPVEGVGPAQAWAEPADLSWSPAGEGRGPRRPHGEVVEWAEPVEGEWRDA